MTSQPPETSRGIRVIHLYDEYLNIYADRGNIAVLQRRCAWRGLTCDVAGLGLDDSFNPANIDLIYVGGGQDRDQRMIAERFATTISAPLRDSVTAGVPVLAVCGGYQLLGGSYLDVSGVMQPGAGLLDVTTEAGDGRLVGNAAVDVTLPAVGSLAEQSLTVAGFENHAGRTHLGPNARPFGRIRSGYGNDGTGNFEGCIDGRVIGTYLHGPLLPRNPRLADWLIAAALDHRYGDAAPQLADLDDTLAETALGVSIARAVSERR